MLNKKKNSSGILFQWYPSTRKQSAVDSEIFRVEPFNNQSEANEMADYYGLSAKISSGIPQQGTNQQWPVKIFE